eukprot:EG_transcript_2334
MSAFTASALICALLIGVDSVHVPPLKVHPVFNNRFIVKWKSSIGIHPDGFSAHIHATSSRSRVQMFGLRHSVHSRQSIVQLAGYTPSAKAAARAALLRSVAADPAVEYIVEDTLMYPDLVPNDPQYGAQWHYDGVVSGGIYPQNLTYGMNLPDAWARTTGAAIVVAVVDTGITNHPDLNASALPGYDMISPNSPGVFTTANDGDGRDSDPSDPGDWTSRSNSSWHGTHVSGTVAAVTNNNLGVAGVAWGAKILTLRALGTGGGMGSDIMDSIRWAAGVAVDGAPANPHPARVINLSLGGTGNCSEAYQEAIDEAISAGAILVVSAGNENQDASVKNPCNCKHVICVAAHGPSGLRARYSNYGKPVDITAPGGDILVTGVQNNSYAVLSTYNTGTEEPEAPSYAALQGTSMAAPHVAGLVALMLSLNANLTWEPVESILKLTARAFPDPDDCDTDNCGAGLADAARALDFVANMPANDRCESAISVSCGQTVQGSVQNATALSADPQCGGTTQTGADVWYSISLAGTTTLGLSTSDPGTNFDTQVNVYKADCSSLTCVAGNDNITATNSRSNLTYTAAAGNWLIRVSGAAQARGSYTLAVTCVTNSSVDAKGNAQSSSSNNGWWIGLAAGLGATAAGVAALVGGFFAAKAWSAAHAAHAAEYVENPSWQAAPQAVPSTTPVSGGV